MKKVLLIAFILIIFGLGVFVYNKQKSVDIVVNEDEKPKSEWAFDEAVPGVTTDICKNSDYLPEEWGNAWTEIFAGSDLEGMSIDDVWALYESSTMAYMSSQGGHGENSELREMSLDIE